MEDKEYILRERSKQQFIADMLNNPWLRDPQQRQPTGTCSFFGTNARNGTVTVTISEGIKTIVNVDERGNKTVIAVRADDI